MTPPRRQQQEETDADAPKDEGEDKGEDKDKGKEVDEDEDQVSAATCARSQTSMRISPRLATARPQRITHIRRLQLVATLSEHASTCGRLCI